MSKSELTDRVGPHPDLSGAEKETSISMFGDSKEFTVFSAKPTIVKSLLKHDYFDMDWAIVSKSGTTERIEDLEILEESDGQIVSIEGTLPVGTLTVKSKPRANNHQSSIVSTEGIDPSVFGDNQK